jgi:polysaccharide biosynthesis protein PslH
MNSVPNKPPALILLPEAPYPTRGGGALRSACMVDYLARHYCLEAVNFRLAGRQDPAERFPAGYLEGSLTIDLPHHSKAFVPRAWRNAGRALRGVPPLMERFGGRQADLGRFLAGRQFQEIWLEHFWLAPYAPLLRAHSGRLLLDLHNIESRLFETLAVGESPIVAALLRHFAAASLRLERRWLPEFDQVLVCSDADGARAEELGARRVTVVPNTIPSHRLPVGERSKSLVFSGNFEYQPNQQGLRWFIGQCWPQILAAVPDLRLRLVGVGIEFAARHCAGAASIDMVGPVEDAIEEIGRSQIAIVPLLAGSGTRLKILEAWAAGTAVVSTPIGAEGLEAGGGEFVKIASDPASFTQSVLSLVQNEGERSRLATQARLFYERAYTWSSAHQRLADMNL